MIILRLLLLLTNLHLKLLSTQGTGADKLLSTQRVKKSIKYFNVGHLMVRGYSVVSFNALQLAYSDIIMMPCR